MDKQRGFVWVQFLPHIIGGVAIAAVAGILWWKAQHWCNTACQQQKEIAAVATTRALKAEGLLKEAQERATALALLWSKAIQNVEVKYVEVVKWREKRFTVYRERAGTISYSGGIALDPAARGLLRDVANSANAVDAGSPSGDQGTPQAVPAPAGGEVNTTGAEWIEFAISAAEAYRDAADKHRACVEWVGKIREANNE